MKRTRFVGIREVQLTLEQSVKHLIESKIKAFGCEGRFLVRDSYIACPENGGLMIFKGMQHYNAHSIKSLEDFDVAWVEEAHSFSQISLDLLRPTIRNPESELWFSWNPAKETDPVDKFLRRDMVGNPDAIVVEANYYDNPWFPDVLRKEMELDREDPDKYDHVWLGKHLKLSQRRVFRNVRLATPGEMPITRNLLFGADWGFAVDPTVLIACSIDRSPSLKRPRLYIHAEVYKVGCEIDRTPELFDGIFPHLPRMARNYVITADSARPETISYMKRNGYPKIAKSIKGPNSVEEGVSFIQGFEVIISPSCPNTWREFTNYLHPVNKHTGDIIPELIDLDNHTIDAARYAIERERRAKGGVF